MLMLKSSQVPIAPMGTPADLPKSTLIPFISDQSLVLTGICTCQPRLQTSHRPDGNALPTCPNRLSSFNWIDLWFYQGNVRCQPRLQTSHRPDGKIADALASTHACTTANALVNHSGYVLQRPCNVPIAPMGKCLVDMSISILIFYDGCCLELPGWSTC
jgi:hypothetical protein